MQSQKDGKTYKTDILDTKGILSLDQSIPSPKAEPFKMWLTEEVSTTAISKEIKPNTFNEIKRLQGRVGDIAKNARRQLVVAQRQKRNFKCQCKN